MAARLRLRFCAAHLYGTASVSERPDFLVSDLFGSRLRGWLGGFGNGALTRSEEHTSELQSLRHLVCRLLLEKKKYQNSSPLCRSDPDERRDSRLKPSTL